MAEASRLPPVSAMLNLERLTALVETDEIDTVIVAFPDHYGRLHGKRFDAGFFVEETHEHGTHACDYLLTADMEMEPVAGYDYANWDLGYGDFHLVPDMATMRRADWLPGSAIVICDVVDPETHEPVGVAPRTVLKNQIERAAEAGFMLKAASELEYFVFEDSYRDAATAGYNDLTPVGWYREDYHLLQGGREEAYTGAVRRHLGRSGVPVESSKGEWGRGQHELNIRYAEVLTMADRHSVMKLAMKDVADVQGISVTFMAKPRSDDAGSSCHLHMSLWAGADNAFSGVGPGSSDATNEFRWFLGGLMAQLPELMVCFAPTVNSYKRFEDGSWAPTRIAWSHDNRSAAFRVVGSDRSRRIECRVPGADCNPYLAYAAALAAGLSGIAARREPPEPFSGDGYSDVDLPSLPSSLRDATDRFERSEFARSAFGEEAHSHYAHFFRSEQEAFDREVTDWERRRYFERI